MTVKEILGLMFDSLDELDKNHKEEKEGPCTQCLGQVFNVYYKELRKAYDGQEII